MECCSLDRDDHFGARRIEISGVELSSNVNTRVPEDVSRRDEAIRLEHGREIKWIAPSETDTNSRRAIHKALHSIGHRSAHYRVPLFLIEAIAQSTIFCVSNSAATVIGFLFSAATLDKKRVVAAPSDLFDTLLSTVSFVAFAVLASIVAIITPEFSLRYLPHSAPIDKQKYDFDMSRQVSAEDSALATAFREDRQQERSKSINREQFYAVVGKMQASDEVNRDLLVALTLVASARPELERQITEALARTKRKVTAAGSATSERNNEDHSQQVQELKDQNKLLDSVVKELRARVSQVGAQGGNEDQVLALNEEIVEVKDRHKHKLKQIARLIKTIINISSPKESDSTKFNTTVDELKPLLPLKDKKRNQ